MNDHRIAAPRLILFDLDGTLVDSGADIAAAANQARLAARLAPISDAVARSYVGDGVQCLMQRVLAHDLETGERRLPVSDEQLARGLADFAGYYHEHLLDRTALYPGITDLLAGLGDRELMVATNKPRRFTLAILSGLGIADRFTRVVAGDDTGARKPDPEHLRACLAGADHRPDTTVMVGDSPNDVLAARGLGMPSVAVSWGLVARQRLVAAQPTVLVDSVTDLARELSLDSGGAGR